MSLKGHLEKLRLVDALIRKKSTGNQKTFAAKMRLSRSGLNKLIGEMREIGFPIRYSHQQQTYYYENGGGMVKKLFVESFVEET